MGKTPLDNYSTVYRVAEEAGIKNLTLDTQFGQLLMYTTTEDDLSKFDQQCFAFREELSKREVIIPSEQVGQAKKKGGQFAALGSQLVRFRER